MVLSSIQKAWFVSAGHPVYSGDQYLGGVICDLDLGQLKDLVANVYPSDSGFAMLLDSSGCVILAPDKAYTTIFFEVPSSGNHTLKCLSSSMYDFSEV